MELSIIIPALNEEKTVAICVQKALKSIQDLHVDGEVIVADNGSEDSTAAIAKNLGAKVISVSTKGYGFACIEGLKAASGKYLIMADADDSYNFEEIEHFFAKLKEGYELVVGNRFKGKIAKGAMPLIHRYFGTPALTWLLNLFFHINIGDINCGMRAMTKKAFEEMLLMTGGMEFATEMLIKASLRKLKIGEVPCNLYADKRGASSHLNTWVDGWKHLRFMLLFSPSWVFLFPGLLLSFIGLLGMIILTLRDLISPSMIWFIDQKHIISCMLLLICGYQIVQFGISAHLFSYSKYFDYKNRVSNYIISHFKLEKGIMIGLLLFFIGVGIFGYLLISCFSHLLPHLNNFLRFDLAIFGVTFVVFGMQTAFASFLLSTFFIKIK